MRQRSRLRDAVEYGLASLALNSLAYTPLPVSNFLARGYVRALDLALPRLRRVAMGNLAMALPQTDSRDRTRIVDGVFRSIARLLVAFARFPRMNRASVGRWIRYEGFERVDRLAPIAIVEGETTPLGPACALWLLDQPPRDRPASPSGLDFEGVLEDSIEEFVFADQAEVARLEQQRFERNLEQIERYIEDQLLVLRRHLSTATAGLRASEDKRDAALGSDARTEAEERIRKVQREIDDLERQIARLQNREDPLYERWREHAHH